jgi:hypothetical protein
VAMWPAYEDLITKQCCARGPHRRWRPPQDNSSTGSGSSRGCPHQYRSSQTLVPRLSPASRSRSVGAAPEERPLARQQRRHRLLLQRHLARAHQRPAHSRRGLFRSPQERPGSKPEGFRVRHLCRGFHRALHFSSCSAHTPSSCGPSARPSSERPRSFSRCLCSAGLSGASQGGGERLSLLPLHVNR